MDTDGRIYKTIVVSKPDKYTDELKERIEELGSLCLNNLNQDDYHPIMMLGSIQSGKTRAFIGLMALCFDKDYDMPIILNKCSKALVQQTVSRMMAEFAEVKSGKSNIGDVVAQNILDIDFGSETTEAGKQKIVRQFLKRYPEKKRIIVVKKQADNVDRMIRLINEIVASNKYKRILIVDDEAAEHLKSIFSMYMDGRNYSDIARQLNKDGVLSPTLQRKFYKTGEKPLPESKPWNNYEVKRVLQDVHCTGDSVFGKYQQSVFQGNKQRNRPESEWVHVENTHEGIIDRELFQQVQSKIQEYTEAYKKKHQQNNGAIRNHNFYTGKIWCGGCGNRMTLSRERNGTFFYICGANTNHKSGGKQCKGHRVRKEYVDDDVLRLIQTHMKTVLDTEKMIQEMNTASKNQTQYLLLDKEVGKLRRELSRISKRKSDLYEDYSERLITEEEYIQFSRIYSNEIENIKSRLDTVLAAQVRYSQDYHIEEGWGNVIHTYMSKRKLTKEMADAFVDSIIIHGKYDYEIKLVYDDQFADLQKLKKEKEAQTR